ncbi:MULTISPECIES: DNA primase [Actibacterium]|uniref:DNA primase n=1 Tax=Actibacterium naphthalenivorans TaxID=1614693 RepID=A0A840CDH6_9RHOB|nr:MULTISPECIES: DNA primase [Actibacterium]ALG91004.1 DNA primase [Actibacterium sp. EMB200-NS6]MBB4023385.1 DNA primase [Actibacterium naphthalenivorans]
MSLPPGFLDELRTRTSLSQVVGRKVMWDPRKSNQSKGDMWAPCPFHQEKSASFHVDDRKGYYYCFGCHAKGDAISFIRETENVGFMEAIEILAAEAGMTMPARDPQAQQKSDRRSQLIEVMEQAVQYYRLQSKTAAAGDARAYLARRGLSEAAQERWEIGFAPDMWQGLWDHLTGKGITPDLIMGAGLAKPSQRGGKPYDTFRGRIMFPIRDARGRAIAFGGRAMDPNDNAKYLNSPETELFDKGRSLFNHGPAREAAGKGKPLIVAEGYMDVIALAEAGFGATVAPLGTAITDTQLQLMWRIHPEPIIALDGDTAGLRAAMRVIDLALPQLEAGQSLRFALMPQGQDPDDVIRSGGAGAMQKLLDQARPMVQLLWQRETEGRVFDSPERKAALDKDLRKAIATIKDPSIRGHYGEEIKRLRWELFGQRRTSQQRPGKWRPRDAPALPMPTTRNSALVSGPPRFEEELREAVILATLVTHPALLPEFEGELERLEFVTDDHRRIQGALLTHLGENDPEALRAAIAGTLGPGPLEKLFAQSHVQIAPPLLDRADSEKAMMCLAEELAKLDAARGAAREIEDAVEDLAGLADEGLTWRLGQVAEARNRAGRGDTEDKGEYDIGPNGARMSREERNSFDRLLEQINFTKGGRRPS